MAQKVLTMLIDDIDGTEASETVSFGMEGASYEIDLSARHAEELREKLAPYAEHARKVRAEVRRTVHYGQPVRHSRKDTAETREWLIANGYGDQLNNRGRIPGYLVAMFEARTPNVIEKQAAAPAAPAPEPEPVAEASKEKKTAAARRPRKTAKAKQESPATELVAAQ